MSRSLTLRRKISPSYVTLWKTLSIIAVLSVAVLGIWKVAHQVVSEVFAVETLEKRFERIAAKYTTIDVGIVAQDVSSGDSASIQATKPFRAASTTKLLTASLYLRQVDQQKATLDDLIGPYPAWR